MGEKERWKERGRDKGREKEREGKKEGGREGKRREGEKVLWSYVRLCFYEVFRDVDYEYVESWVVLVFI